MDAFLEELIREREEKARQEARQEAAREAERANSREIARCFIALGNDSLEEIAQATGLSLDEVKLLAQEQSA